MAVALGIKFADAPRFEPPVRCASRAPLGRFGPSSPQPQGGYYTMPTPGLDVVGTMDEDCLYLNVWAPDDRPGPLPVLLFIHGGGFNGGGADCPTYDGKRLADHGAVVVTINYRLGALGFYRGCWGLLDMICALEWVRDSIGTFGGDPGRVTVFGESAGASAILHLLATPRADGLFHRAIVQSPGASRMYPSVAAEIAGLFDRELGATPRAVGTAELLRAQVATAERLAGRRGPMPWHPVIDGEVIVAEPLDAILSGRARTVPVLLGATAEEIRIFVRPEFDAMTTEQLVPWVGRYLRAIHGLEFETTAIVRMLEPYEGLEGSRLYTAVCTDQGIRVPLLHVADALAQQGSPVFSYSFDWTASKKGAGHTVDLPFTFGTVDQGGWEVFWTAPLDEARRVSDLVMSAWVAFASTGDPSIPGLPAWPRFESEGRPTMSLGPSCRVVAAPAARAIGVAQDLAR